MFSKAVALLLFATSTIAGPIAAGTYRITNVASGSSARVYKAGDTITVSSDRTDPGPFALWDIQDANNNGYTIDNVGSNLIQMLDTFAAVRVPQDGEPVITDRQATVFNIELAGPDGTYIIKLPYEDLLWNVEPPVVPTGAVKLRSANGAATEQWRFTPVQWP